MKPGRPRDPRGRPRKHFTAVVELFDKLELRHIWAHDPAHAKALASAQVKRATSGVGYFEIKAVLHGFVREAT